MKRFLRRGPLARLVLVLLVVGFACTVRVAAQAPNPDHEIKKLLDYVNREHPIDESSFFTFQQIYLHVLLAQEDFESAAEYMKYDLLESCRAMRSAGQLIELAKLLEGLQANGLSADERETVSLLTAEANVLQAILTKDLFQRC